MKHLIRFLTLVIVICCLSSCAPKADSSSDIRPTFTIREIMKSMVEPRADTLWNAVAVSVTEKGIETNAPQTQEDWDKIRNEAVTLTEAMNLIVDPNRRMAKVGEQAKDPKIELTPDQISELINKDRASWTNLAHALQDSVMVAVAAIDEKNADKLMEAGAGIDTACENCHKMYWYPNDEGAANPEEKKEEAK